MGTRLSLIATLVFLSFASSLAVHAEEIWGAGSTFVSPLLGKWSEIYKAGTFDKMTYLSIGSGGGITKIKEGNVDFAATDMPIPSEELAKSRLGQFPIVIGGVVPIVNIAGIKPGQIRLTGHVIAEIFLGNIENWSSPTIKALNPDLSLPNEKITVVHRADGSGTTFNWASFLSNVDKEWQDKIGVGTGLAWPTGIGAKGNEGVAASVMQVRNSIGYVEYTYVLQSNLTFALVQNKAGKFVAPSSASFKAAAENVDWDITKNFYASLTDAVGEEAYPITAATFVLMYKEPASSDRGLAALKFFEWALTSGQMPAAQLGYVPLPPELVHKVLTYWASEFHFHS